MVKGEEIVNVKCIQVVERVASAKAVGERSELASRNLRLLEKVGQEGKKSTEGRKELGGRKMLRNLLTRCSKRLLGTTARSH